METTEKPTWEQLLDTKFSLMENIDKEIDRRTRGSWRDYEELKRKGHLYLILADLDTPEAIQALRHHLVDGLRL